MFNGLTMPNIEIRQPDEEESPGAYSAAVKITRVAKMP